MGNSRFQRWKVEFKRCELTRKFECGVRRSNQLTGDEVIKIRTLAASKKYQHFSLTALWKFAYRNNIVVCSKDIWFKYINLYDLKRNMSYDFRKDVTKIGVRAKSPNEIWHLDLSVIELATGGKVYFQAIIDNYSRYIINWNVSAQKDSINTQEIIQKSKLKIDNIRKKTSIYMDSGGENTAKIVKNIFIGSNLKQIFAQVDVRYSNSMIEAFFRSLKVNYLYSKRFNTIEDLRRCIKFYVNTIQKSPIALLIFKHHKKYIWDCGMKKTTYTFLK